MSQPQHRTLPSLSSTELEQLRQDLVASSLSEAYHKLGIYQYTQILNATRFITKKTSAQKSKQSTDGKSCSSTTSRRGSSFNNIEENDSSDAPDERVLNEIQLNRELEALRRIYKLALDSLEGEDFLASLNAAVQAQKSERNETEIACDQLRENRQLLKALKQELTTKQQEAEERLLKADERLATLRQNRRNVHLLNELEVRLVQQWEENRYTQACIVGEKEQRALSEQIAELQRRIANEQRLIQAVDTFSERQFEELNEKIVEWQHKYADEMRKMEAKTQAKEQSIAELQKSLERHKETYAERVQYVKDYLEQKEVERQLYEQEMHRVDCAVQIQAWWRGTMVRRGLGPYKKKTKGKGKKGKGGKGGK